MRTLSIFAVAVLIFSLLQRPAHALSIGQVDDFEDGTTASWVVNLLGQGNPPSPPVNMPSGGPQGADDNFLLLTATGQNAAGGRLTAINIGQQWSGDYLAAGITGFTMDVINLGTTDLILHLLFEDPTAASPPANIALSPAFGLPAGTGWTQVHFAIDPASLTAQAGSATAALAGATAIRIFHAGTPFFPGEPIVGTLGVDNIRAVPEPDAWMIAALGLAFGVFALRARRNARSG